MTPDGYASLIRDVVRKADSGDSEPLQQLSIIMSEMDQAKQELSDAGFSWIGLSLLKSVRLIIESIHAER